MAEPIAESCRPEGSAPCDIVLRATYGSTAAWLYNVIDAAIWLGRHCKASCPGPVRIRVVLIPLRPRVDLARSFRSAVHRVAGWLPGRWPERWKGRVPIRWGTRLGRVFEHRSTTSLHSRIGRAETVRVTHGRYELVIDTLAESWWESACLWLKCRRLARTLWLQCFDGRTFVPTRFLALRHGAIQIGDLAASSTLKSVASMAGSLQPSRQLFRSLTAAVYLCELSNSLHVNALADEHVLAAEPSYLDSVPKRALHAKGAAIVEPTCYLDRYEVIHGDEPYRNPWLAKPSTAPISDADAVEAHLCGRLFESGAHLWYMSEGANDNYARSLTDQHGKSITHLRDLVVTVFLHSFDDGQYFFGVDGFDDMFAWTKFTIDRCLANSGIRSILVKDHPGAQHRRFTGHATAVRRLREVYRSESRVTFLRSNSSLVRLCQEARFFGITHHGSVAEEVVFLGQPMIGSVRAPWERNYPFLTVWNTVAEYGNILDGLSTRIWRPPSIDERKALFRYVQEYRLKTLPTVNLDPWLKFAQIMGDENDEFSHERFVRYNRELEGLEMDDPRFDAFLSAMDVDSRKPWQHE
jgi:hypothetical protein